MLGERGVSESTGVEHQTTYSYRTTLKTCHQTSI